MSDGYLRDILLLVTLPVVAIGVLSACGCDGGDPAHGDPLAPAASVSHYSTWRIDGTLKNLKYAVDGDDGTAAVAEGANGTAVVTIDLGKACVFNMAMVNHGPDEMGFCRRLEVSTSDDGINFTVRKSVPGTRRITYVNMVAPVMARYVRLTVLTPGGRPWSVGEICLR